jgi:hypothetical protein
MIIHTERWYGDDRPTDRCFITHLKSEETDDDNLYVSRWRNLESKNG